MTCRAKPRPSYNRTGWTCHGRRLLTVMYAEGGALPVVIPQWSKRQVMSSPHASALGPVEPFKGGDHVHMVVAPRREMLMRWLIRHLWPQWVITFIGRRADGRVFETPEARRFFTRAGADYQARRLVRLMPAALARRSTVATVTYRLDRLDKPA